MHSTTAHLPASIVGMHTEVGVVLTAYVEIDAGQERCGVPAASDQALHLATLIEAAPGA